MTGRAAIVMYVRPDATRHAFSLKWLRSNPCPGPVWQHASQPNQPNRAAPGAVVRAGHQVLHSSHVLVRYRGVVWCWRCGAVTTVAAGRRAHAMALVQMCTHPTRSQNDCLRRLRKGLTPRPRDIWPEADNGEVFPPVPVNLPDLPDGTQSD